MNPKGLSVETALSDLLYAADTFRVTVNEWDPEHDSGPTEEEMDEAEANLLRAMDNARTVLKGG